MGIKDIFKKGKVREGCKRDPETGNLRCESVRVHADGTEEVIGSLDLTLDQDCKPMVTDQFETEDGTLDRIQKKFVNKIAGKCRSLPQDY